MQVLLAKQHIERFENQLPFIRYEAFFSTFLLGIYEVKSTRRDSYHEQATFKSFLQF